MWEGVRGGEGTGDHCSREGRQVPAEPGEGGRGGGRGRGGVSE